MTLHYEIQPLSWIVKPKGEKIYSDMATIIHREDEGGDQFVIVEQTHDNAEKGKIRLDPVEWEAIKQAVEKAFCEILADELHDIGESK